MCRSEPQIAVEVTLMMASRWLRIVGSGTSRTSILRIPIQQFAFMTTPFVPDLQVSVDGCRRQRLRRPRRRAAARIGEQHFAELEHLLEPAQIVADLLARLFAEQLEQAGRDLAAGRRVAHLDGNDRPEPARRLREPYGAAMVNSRSADRLPCDQRVRLVGDDLGFPFDARPGGPARAPSRAAVAELLDRLDAFHELREAREIAPERIGLGASTADRDAAQHAAGGARDALARRALSGFRELLGGKHVERSDAEHGGRRQQSPQRPLALDEREAERREIDDVPGYARADPFLRLGMRKDAGAARELAQRHTSQDRGCRRRGPKANGASDAPRREQLDGAERNAHETQKRSARP